MPNYRSTLQRFMLAAGIAGAVLGSASLGVSTAGADPGPLRAVNATFAASISQLEVRPGGHEATVSFTTAEPTVVSYDLKRVDAPVGPRAGVGGLPNGGVLSSNTGPAPAPDYKTQHQIALKNLTSNTEYEVSVTATTKSGQRLNGSARFRTLKQRLRVTLEHIDIGDDGDSFFRGDGEPQWRMDLTFNGTPNRMCFPLNCSSYGNYGEGRIVPRDPSGNLLAWLLPEEIYVPMPEVLTISVQAKEDDGPITGNPHQLSTATAEWRVPRGVESASTRIQVRGDEASAGFRSLLTFNFELFYDNADYGIR